MKKFILFCVLLFSTNAAYCQESTRIELTDGSVVNGEVVSFAGGTYTVNTASLGQISIPASKVYKIEMQADPAAGHFSTVLPSGDLSQQVQDYKQKMMQDPQSAALITGLSQNPQIQGIAQDPDIMKAAQSGDIKSLMENPKFQELVNNPDIQEAVKKLKK